LIVKKVKAPAAYKDDWVQYANEPGEVVTRKAYVTYPFDYRSGITTVDVNEYKYAKDTMTVMNSEAAKVEKMFPAEFKSIQKKLQNPITQKHLLI